MGGCLAPGKNRQNNPAAFITARYIRTYSRYFILILAYLTIAPAYGYARYFRKEAQYKNAGNKKSKTKSSVPFLDWNLNDNLESVFVPEGAIRSGATYDQLLQARLMLHTKPMGLWPGGRLLVSAVQIAGGQPSANEIGDLQVASNIAAKPAVRVYEFSYKQDFPLQFDVSLGLINMNRFIANVNDASVLLNSSFGIEPDISANVPVSIYPKPGWGISVAKYLRNIKIEGSLFQNNPADRSDLSFRKYMANLEVDYRMDKGIAGKPATFDLGIWHHSAITNSLGGKPHPYNGYYVNVEQNIVNRSIRKTCLFLQWGSSPLRASSVPYYLGLGILINRPFASRPLDQFSAGMAKAWTNEKLSDAETAFEMTYLFHADKIISIQPDVQYIRHPSGRVKRNALAFFLRCSVSVN